MPKFAANLTWMFQEYDFLERFAAAAALGFSAVECRFPYAWERAQLSDRLNDAGQKQIVFNTPPGDADQGEYGLAALPGRESEFQDSIGLAVDYADALDCKMLHVLAGIADSGPSVEQHFETFMANLEWAVQACGRAGITILIEPINPFERPGYLISTTAQARQAIDQLDSSNVAIQFDFHNAQLVEGNLSALFEQNLSYIRHVQIAGVPGRTPPDQGEIHYPYLFDLIDELGYTGWVGCEFTPGESTAAGLAWARRYGIGGSVAAPSPQS